MVLYDGVFVARGGWVARSRPSSRRTRMPNVFGRGVASAPSVALLHFTAARKDGLSFWQPWLLLPLAA